MPSELEPESERDALGSSPNIQKLRRNLVRILFVNRSRAAVQRCLHELKRMRFTVISKTLLTSQRFAEELNSAIYDIVVAEYRAPKWQEVSPLGLLRQMKKDLPFIYLVHALKRETTADLILKGAIDCVEIDNLGHLPVAVHRALDEKVLRDQRDRAEKDLRRSEARYRALVGNLSYGICRCSLDGGFLEVNEAMIKMLGYESREEILSLDLARDTLQDPRKRAQLLGQSGSTDLGDPIEIEWPRKDRATLKVRLSGREVLTDHGELEAYEVIAEDITRQRELEDHLRRQAACDPLTGLSNYRHFVDVLDSEIKRSKRSTREFSLLFFDLDGLKLVNDRYGHVTGSQALCRLADVLCSCCRDVDTPARFGGDEFALILPETNAQTAKFVARRICESVASDGKGPPISVSVGAATYPQDGQTIETLLSAADSAVYAMKRQRIRVLEVPDQAGVEPLTEDEILFSSEAKSKSLGNRQ
jgi:diguanylate cyclase (GGDEF)-like protein/PAS domain S-box-containing protein